MYDYICNAGCEVIFGRWDLNVEVRYNGTVIMRGSKSAFTSLWHAPITQSEVNLNQQCELQRKTATYALQVQSSVLATSATKFSTQHPPITVEDDESTIKTSNATQTAPIASNVTTKITTFSQAELAMYDHQSLGNPRKDTLTRALRKHPTQFATFPGLTYELIWDHLLPSEAAEKVHMILTRKGLKSTGSMAKQLGKAMRDIGNFFPAEEVCLAEDDEVYCCAILGNSNDSTIYSDLIERFPMESNGKKTQFYCVHEQTKFYFYDTDEKSRQGIHD